MCLLALFIRAIIALMMEAAGNPETSVDFAKVHGAASQKIAIFIIVSYLFSYIL
jgi:hypothetical protein